MCDATAGESLQFALKHKSLVLLIIKMKISLRHPESRERGDERGGQRGRKQNKQSEFCCLPRHKNVRYYD